MVLAARDVDMSTYNTLNHPEQYEISWRGFYEDGLRRTASVADRFPHEWGVLYGDHPAKMLDLYRPEKSSVTARPIFIFLHGGAFREGHPRHYGFVGEPYLERDVIFIAGGHRMAPEVLYPDTREDVADLVAWVYRKASEFGGDPEQIFLGGHSSGATVSALLGVTNEWQRERGVPDNVIKGLVLAGATYDFRDDFVGNLVAQPERRIEASAICNIARVPDAAVFTFGVHEVNRGDPTRFERYARPLAEAMTAHGCATQVFPLASADHHGSCEAVCDRDGGVFDAAIRMMTAGKS